MKNYKFAKGSPFLLLTVILMLVFSGIAVGADPSLDEIMAKATAKLENISTVSLRVSMKQVDPSTGRGTKMGMTILADKKAGLARMTFTEPAAFKDQVMIIDQKGKVAKVYTPITNQVLVTKLDKSGNELGMNMNFDEMIKIPDKDDYDIKLLGKEKIGKVDHYVLHTRNKKNAKMGSQKLWISSTDFLASRLEMYDTKNRLTATIDISNFKTGLTLDKKTLTKLPADAEVVQQ